MSDGGERRENKLKIFISWSGEPSKAFAEGLAGWLRRSLQTVDPFVSSNNVPQGTRSLTVLAKELESTNLGIICLTKKTISSPWILFESGALSKAANDNRLWTILLDLNKPEITTPHPLSQFQHTETSREDIRKLFGEINDYASSNGLSPLHAQDIDDVFDKWWPDFKEMLTPFRNPEDHVSEDTPPVSDETSRDQETLNEIPGHVRDLPRLKQQVQLIGDLLGGAFAVHPPGTATLSESMAVRPSGSMPEPARVYGTLPWRSAETIVYTPHKHREQNDDKDPPK